MRLLLIEDDREVAAFIDQSLSELGYEVEIATDGREGLEKALSQQFELCIIDRMLPYVDGIGIIEKIKEAGVQSPILILSAMADVSDKVDGLQAGGDDYLVKPFAIEELNARIDALLRREKIVNTSLKVGDLEMNLLTQKVQRAGQAITLQPREFKLLNYLMKNAGRAVTRNMLLENVWDYHFDPQTNFIDVHISRLRQKIDKKFSFPLIKTVRGVGYILNEN